MKSQSALISIIAAAFGCGALFLEPNDEKRPKKTLEQLMKHEEERMSGKVLWRNNKNHAAGSECACGFTADPQKCTKEEDDDSHCFMICCIAGKASDCKCGWAIKTQNACDPSMNDGSDCFVSCCNDVANDLQTYGPLAYPGAEIYYPPGAPVPVNPHWKPNDTRIGQQLMQPGNASKYQQGPPTGRNGSQGYQSYPTGAQSYAPGGYALSGINVTSNRNANVSEMTAEGAPKVHQKHQKGHSSTKPKHHKGKHN